MGEPVEPFFVHGMARDIDGEGRLVLKSFDDASGEERTVRIELQQKASTVA